MSSWRGPIGHGYLFCLSICVFYGFPSLVLLAMTHDLERMTYHDSFWGIIHLT